MKQWMVGFLGFGEAGSAFARGLAKCNSITMSAYDIKVHDCTHKGSLLEQCSSLDVTCAHSPAEAVSDCNAIFSVVTASQAVQASRSIGGNLVDNPWYFDCNSCSPDSKRLADREISQLGGRYIDVAVMAPVLRENRRIPLLVSGNDSEEAADFLNSVGMNAAAVGEGVGEAAAIKLVRSIFVKGVEAATMECALAARRAGVDGHVFRSLTNPYAAHDWETFAGIVVGRMLRHGRRRAEEMEAAQGLLRSLDLPYAMSSGASFWQNEIARIDTEGDCSNLGPQLDRILQSLDNERIGSDTVVTGDRHPDLGRDRPRSAP